MLIFNIFQYWFVKYQFVDKTRKRIGVEFIMEIHSQIYFCAFNIIKDHYSYTPGMVNMNVIDDYYKILEMRHIYYTIPSYWEDLQGHLIDGHIVNWLFAIPISDNELDYLNENGVDAFEDLLESNDTEVYDLYRRSII